MVCNCSPFYLKNIEYITGEIHLPYGNKDKDIPEYNKLMNKLTQYVDKDKVSFKVVQGNDFFIKLNDVK